MKIQEQWILMRIYIGESDKCKHGKPLYESIVKKARELNIAGATVLRGILGFGNHSRIHSLKFLSLSEDLPIVIEIADKEENIKKIMPFIDQNVKEGLVTIEKVNIIKYS